MEEVDGTIIIIIVIVVPVIDLQCNLSSPAGEPFLYALEPFLNELL